MAQEKEDKKMSKECVTIELSADGYGPEAEARGPAYLGDLHSAYISHVSEHLANNVISHDCCVEDLGLAGETKFTSGHAFDRDRLVNELQIAWEDWCTSGWDAWELSRKQ